MEIPYRHRTRYEVIRRVVLAALGEHPRLLGRRRMATCLRSLADELEEGHVPRGHGGPANVRRPESIRHVALRAG